MPCGISTFDKVNVGGSKNWIIPHEDRTQVGDTMYCTITATHQQFIKFVTEGCGVVVDQNSTIVDAPGLVELQRLRNEMQSHRLAQPSGAANLFQEATDGVAPKARMVPRGRVYGPRDEVATLTITVPPFGDVTEAQELSVIAPCHPSDRLRIPLVYHDVKLVTDFIRHHGFVATTTSREYLKSGVQGVWARKDKGWIVKEPVSKKRRCAKDIDGALSLLDGTHTNESVSGEAASDGEGQAEAEPPAAETEPPAVETEPPAAEAEPPAVETEPLAASATALITVGTGKGCMKTYPITSFFTSRGA